MVRSKVLVLDGNSLYHRAHHAYERSALTDSDGNPVFAAYGFFVLLAGICQKVNPDALIVGFDSPRNERKSLWPQYKATRTKKDDEFYTQLNRTVRLVESLGVAVLQPDGWEADDVCGSVAHAASMGGWDCVVATSDRDAFCLIDKNTSVLRLVSGLDNADLMTEETFREMMLKKTGFPLDASLYRQYAALRGDTSDNLPGVKGIGEKTAAKLLSTSSVEEVLADPASFIDILGKSVVEKLVAGQENYRLNLSIMDIRRDVEVSLENAVLKTDFRTVEKLLTPLFPSIASRVAAALTQDIPTTDNAQPENLPATVVPEVTSQLSLFS